MRNATEFRLPHYEPNWLLIFLPTVIAFSVLLPSKLHLFLLIGVGVLSFWRSRPAQDRVSSRLGLSLGSAILPVLSLTIILRPNAPATVSNAAVYVIALFVFLYVLGNSGSRSSAFLSLIDGIGIFLVVSVLLTFIGVASTSDRTAGLENSISGGKRVIFALSPHLAATPGAAGVFVVAVVPILIAFRQFRFLRLAAVAFAIYVLIASQVRMAILAAIVVSVSAFAFPRVTRAISPWLIAFLLSLPFFFRNSQSDIMGQLGSVVATNVPGMNRAGDAGGVLSTRQDIWEKAQAFHSAWADWAHQVFGYGSFGHVESGAALAYTTADNFTGFTDRHLITPHSSTLMVLFDAGWVGVAVFIATIVFAARVLARGHSPIDLAASSALVGLSIIGATELGLTPETNLTVWWLLIGLVAVALSREEPPGVVRKPAVRRGLISQATPAHPISREV